jgi:hypothetical protein
MIPETTRDVRIVFEEKNRISGFRIVPARGRTR